MAIVLRCPACKAKLKLKEEPEPGTEIECSKCGEVFAWEGHQVSAGSGADADEKSRPKAKSAAAGDKARKAESGERSAAKPGEKSAATAAGPATAVKTKKKKRRLKKRKTKPAVLAAIIASAVFVVAAVAGVFVWFLTKKSMSQEMMSYLPDDCDEVFGLNLGHLQKYPEFYKACQSTFANTGFRKAGDLLGSVLGLQNLEGAVEYVIQGSGRAGGANGAPLEATVFRIKEEFDPGLLAKLPGARKASAAGVDYYLMSDPGFRYPGGGVRVFAPTNRLVVFCNANIPENKFQSMLTGNQANPDATPYVRGGPLAKQVSRGTAWKFMIYGRSVARYTAPPRQTGQGSLGDQNPEELLQKEVADILANAQGSGYKASVGSRDVRGEWIVWYKDSDAASSMLKKWKEKDWVQDDEKEPPRWFKALANKSGAGKTAENVIRDGLAFRASGELFSVRTSVETLLLQSGGVGQVVQNFTGQTAGGFGGGMGGPMPGPGGPMPGPGGPMPGPGGRWRSGVRLARRPPDRLQSWR